MNEEQPEEELWNGAPACRYAVVVPEAWRGTTCTVFCRGIGAECLMGWNNRDNTEQGYCVADDYVGCNTNYNSQVCLCTRP